MRKGEKRNNGGLEVRMERRREIGRWRGKEALERREKSKKYIGETK